MMNERGKSDSSKVPVRLPNKAEEPAAEAKEGRELAKENSPERNVSRTQSRQDTLSALERVRQAARKDRKQRFTALFHHIYDVDRLRTALFALKKGAAAGVDGETWEHYVENLETNLQDLSHGAMKARRAHLHGVNLPRIADSRDVTSKTFLSMVTSRQQWA